MPWDEYTTAAVHAPTALGCLFRYVSNNAAVQINSQWSEPPPLKSERTPVSASPSFKQCEFCSLTECSRGSRVWSRVWAVVSSVTRSDPESWRSSFGDGLKSLMTRSPSLLAGLDAHSGVYQQIHITYTYDERSIRNENQCIRLKLLLRNLNSRQHETYHRYTQKLCHLLMRLKSQSSSTDS